MTEPQVSWMAIERNAAVVSSEGTEIAGVVEVAGDRTADIFNALVVKVGPHEQKLNLPAERVVAIWPRRVEVDLTAREIARLPVYEKPVVEKLPKEGLFQRVFRPRSKPSAHPGQTGASPPATARCLAPGHVRRGEDVSRGARLLRPGPGAWHRNASALC